MSKLKSVPESAVERSVEVAGHITVERPEQVGDDPWILVTNDDGVGSAVMSAALGAFGSSPRMVVSGINAGVNTGHSVIHSGTVGAALTARTFGSHGLAVSTPRSDPWHWDTAAEVAARVAEWVLGLDGRPLALNLNVPSLPIADIRGIRWADLAAFGYFQVAVRASGRLEFQVSADDETPDPGSDTELLKAGFATLTSLAALQADSPAGDGPGWPPVNV